MFRVCGEREKNGLRRGEGGKGVMIWETPTFVSCTQKRPGLPSKETGRKTKGYPKNGRRVATVILKEGERVVIIKQLKRFPNSKGKKREGEDIYKKAGQKRCLRSIFVLKRAPAKG